MVVINFKLNKGERREHEVLEEAARVYTVRGQPVKNMLRLGTLRRKAKER